MWKTLSIAHCDHGMNNVQYEHTETDSVCHNSFLKNNLHSSV